MTTIEFPNKGGNKDENPVEEPELELQPEGEALDLESEEAPSAASAASPAAVAPGRGRNAASIGLALLLLVSLAAVAVLWKQRTDLRAQVAVLESSLAAADAREAATQNTVGDVAKQLEAIQTLLGTLLTATAADEVGSETEASAATAIEDASETGWVDRALSR